MEIRPQRIKVYIPTNIVEEIYDPLVQEEFELEQARDEEEAIDDARLESISSVLDQIDEQWNPEEREF